MTCYIVNFLHSRKPYSNVFSACMKIITEIIKLYFVKLKFIVIIKIIHFVLFYPYSIPLLYSLYCISLSVSLFLYLFLFHLCIISLFIFIYYYFLLSSLLFLLLNFFFLILYFLIIHS